MEPHVNERAARLVASGMTLTMFALVTPLAFFSLSTFALPALAMTSLGGPLSYFISMVLKVWFPIMQCVFICGTVGPILCLAVPEDSKASRPIFVCVLLSLLPLVVNWALASIGWIALFIAPSLGKANIWGSSIWSFLPWLSFVLMPISSVFFYVFLLRLSKYLRRSDLVARFIKPVRHAGALALCAPAFMLATIFFPLASAHDKLVFILLVVLAYIGFFFGLICVVRLLNGVTYLRRSTLDWSKRTSFTEPANAVNRVDATRSQSQEMVSHGKETPFSSWRACLRIFFSCAAVSNLLFWINDGGMVVPHLRTDINNFVMAISAIIWLLCIFFGYICLLSILSGFLDRWLNRLVEPRTATTAIDNVLVDTQVVPVWSIAAPAILLLGMVVVNWSIEYESPASYVPVQVRQSVPSPVVASPEISDSFIPPPAPSAGSLMSQQSETPGDNGPDLGRPAKTGPAIATASPEVFVSGLRNGGFESTFDLDWQVTAYDMSTELAYELIHDWQLKGEGDYSLLLKVEQAHGSDVQCIQSIAVEANTDYVFTGMVRTQDVSIVQEGGAVGACLCIDEVGISESITGTNDWKVLSVTFNSGLRTEMRIGPRLGYNGSCCTGKAWFDKLELRRVEDDMASGSHSSDPIKVHATIHKVVGLGGELEVEYLLDINDWRTTWVNPAAPFDIAESKEIKIIAASIKQNADECVKSLDGMHSIRSLYVENTESFSLEAFDAINSMTELKDLFLNGCGYLDDDRLLRLTQLKKLENATFWYNNLSDRGISHITSFPSLRHLTLAGGTYIGSGLRELAAMPGVEKLCFLQSAFDDDAIDSLKLFPNVQILNLGGTKISGKSFQKIAEMSNLIELDVWGVAADDEQLMLLDRLPQLTKLSIGETGISGQAIDSFVQRHPDCAVVSDLMPTSDKLQGWSFQQEGHLKTNLKWNGVSPITLESSIIPISFDRHLLGDQAQTGPGIGIYMTNERWAIAMRTPSNWFEVVSSQRAKLRTPCHIAGVFDGKELTLFVDGKKVGSTPVDGPASSEHAIMIGALPDDSGNARNSFLGVISAVRVTQGARYSNDYEIPTSYRTDSNVLLLLDASSGQSGTIKDASARNIAIENVGVETVSSP